MLPVIASAFAAVFLAEIGDKSQLVVMTLATRMRMREVALGVGASVLVLFAAAAALGAGIGRILTAHSTIVGVLAGLAFVGFGILALRGEDEDDDDRPARSSRSSVMAAFLAFAAAELGDKTQFATVALAADRGFLPVFVGASLGELAALALAVTAGTFIRRRVQPELVNKVSAAVFIGIGLVMVTAALL